ncbi:MAG TPA: hypothetical protein VHE34_20675 [Puia sp.]|uniref:hypothetical protein n=1 Tax=Puia sp. TaxID=2045100 RepID=UPI002C4DF5A5|nr:hypothetical protein [Puia sp.]HVU97657.1 hypothetical protein [Puia sp.]
MSTDEFQQLWKAYDAKLERSMELNQRLMTELGTQKVHRAFNWQIAFKFMMIALGIGWNVVVGTLMWKFRTEPVFVASAIVVLCCTGYSVGGYIVQLLIILQIRMSDSILGTQKQLAYLEATIVQTLRVGFLQTPVYTFFFVTKQQLATAGLGFWVTQAIVTGAAVVVTIWVYRTVTVHNAGKKGWVKQMVDNEGGKTIARARAFIREAKEWGKEV